MSLLLLVPSHTQSTAANMMAQVYIMLTLLLVVGNVSVQVLATDFSYPNTTLTRIAFGSCHKRKYAMTTGNNNNNIWKTIQTQAHPQLWLWTGDAVYPPVRGIASTALLETEYRQMLENATLGYASFRPPLGAFGTWDDHDYGGNDVGDEMPDKEARALLFWKFLGRDPPPGHRQGLYSSVVVGLPPRQVKIILLDTRWHRQTHCVPSVATHMPLGAGVACATRWLAAGLFPDWCGRNASLLGEEQWEWFEDEFLNQSESESPAVTLVVSSIQVLTTNPAMESWGHFPAERDRLIQLLSQKTKSLVFLLSGDVHHAEILDPMPLMEHRFLEITSSGLTHDCSKGLYGKVCQPLLDTFTRHRFDDPKNYYIGKNYGTVSLDWEQQVVEIEVHDTSGRTVLSTGPRSWKDLPPSVPWTEEQIQFVHSCMNGHLRPLLKTASAALAVAFVMVRLTPKR